MAIAISNRTYRENRAQFSPDELRSLRGHWVAFSADGLHAVAHAPGLAELIDLVRELGQPLESVGIERIEDDNDSSLGGAELL